MQWGKRSAGSWLLAGLIWSSAACTSFAPSLPPALSDNVPSARDYLFRDGGRAIYFTLDKSLGELPAKEVATYLFVVSGSDCTSMRYFLPQYFRGLEGESGSLRIFMLQKRFVEAHTWGRIAGCSEEFIRADHPSRWIADQTEFIEAQLAAARRAGILPKRIIILGISEGADIVPVLAQRIRGVTHVVILANGGMDPIDAYRLQTQKQGLREAAAVLAALERPPADPDAIEPILGGRTWRYWSELQGLKHSEALLSLNIPVLMAMGEEDPLVPIESAWHARDCFAAKGKTNLTLMTYPGADHGLVSDRGSYLPHFWRTLDLWLENE